jgi:hypothetical protein
MKMKPALKRRQRSSVGLQPTARVVYTQAPVLLGALLRKGSKGWWVKLGGREQELTAGPTLDPALLREAPSGSPVVVDASAEPVIAGLLVTSRSLKVNPDNTVDAQVRRFRVTAEDEVVVRTPGAFLQLLTNDVELYGNRVVSRARELIKILGRMIKLN